MHNSLMYVWIHRLVLACQDRFFNYENRVILRNRICSSVIHWKRKDCFTWISYSCLPSGLFYCCHCFLFFFLSFYPEIGTVRQLSAHVYSLENLWWWKIPPPSYLPHFTNVSFYLQEAREANKQIKPSNSQNHDFSNSYVQMWELDHKEG